MWRKLIFLVLFASMGASFSAWSQSQLVYTVPPLPSAKDDLLTNLEKLDGILDELLLISLTSNEASEKLLTLLPEVQNKLTLLSGKLESSQATLQEQLSLLERVKISLIYSEESQRKYRSDTLWFAGAIGAATVLVVTIVSLLH